MASPHWGSSQQRSAERLHVSSMEPAAAGPRKPPTPVSEIIIAGAITTAAVVTTPPSVPSSSRALLAPPLSYRGAALAATASLLTAAGLGGGALLAWWAVSFHPAHAMLWMVPVGLVLLITPLVACFSVFASGPTPSPAAAADLGA